MFQLYLQWKSGIDQWNKEQALEICCVPIILATEIWNRPMDQAGNKTYRGPVAQRPQIMGWAPKTKCLGAKLAPEKFVVRKGMKFCQI